MILVTGGAGFIGTNFILNHLETSDEPILNLDKLTYAGNLENLASLTDDPRYAFFQGDIADTALIASLLTQKRPRAVIHFAAESHVDRSICGPASFIETNITGTFLLLEAVKAHFQTLPDAEKAAFRFLHVSTDEVYGALKPSDPPFCETTPYAPNSPYSASKAASDHLVRAYHHTYGLPTLTTHCSNNYGPYQFPEKLIPLMIVNARSGKALPIYGDGQQIRDWLYVTDHCRAISRVLEAGKIGDTYAIGGWNEQPNIAIVHAICDALDHQEPKKDGSSYRTQITTVADRPGHDRRYAINASKIEKELGWSPKENFKSGLLKTIHWYLANDTWLQNVQSGSYRAWLTRNYEGRSQSISS